MIITILLQEINASLNIFWKILNYIAARGPALTMDHHAAQLNFARDHVNWGEDDWEPVLWTDELCFCLHTCNRRVRVFRRPNECYVQCNFMHTTLFGGGPLMVWGGISLTARTDMVVLNNGNLNATYWTFFRSILCNLPLIGQHFLLMPDNAWPHAARVVQDYLLEVGIETMAWPARSLDLNPIEHVWDTLWRQLHAHPNQLNNLEDIERLLIEIWDGLDQNTIRNLILSMTRRCQETIRSRGGNIRY